MKIKMLCVLALTAASATAFAAEETGFKAVDVDADGYISMEEAKTVLGLAEIFVAADIDKDGQLNEDEYRSATQS